MTVQTTVLVLHTGEAFHQSAGEALSTAYTTHRARSWEQAHHLLEDDWIQVLLCEYASDEDRANLEALAERWPDIVPIAVVADESDLPAGLERAPVFQCLGERSDAAALRLSVRNAADVFALKRQHDMMSIEKKISSTRPEKTPARRAPPRKVDDGIVRSPTSAMNAVCDRLSQVSPYDISVLVTGESGTGKELAARALHENSLRWEKPFVVENCGALPDDLLESELFGCMKGAYTGAVADRIGLFERANGGTVFLDEIGEISPAFQVKLLRVLQEGELRPLGSTATRRVDVRVIAATNRDLEADVKAGRFREDLYYRLAAVTVTLPPLRERRDDIPVLASALLDKACASLGKPASGFSNDAMSCLLRYQWPGNVRELQNEIQRMLVLSSGDSLTADSLSSRVRQQPSRVAVAPEATEGGTLKNRIRMLEARILREALERHRWNKSRAARELGLSRVGLRNKLLRYGLDGDDAVAVAVSG